MPTGAQAWAIYGVVGVIWLALMVTAGISGQFDQVSKITSIVPALLVGAALFERYVWRWPPLHPRPIHTPVVRGTWRGELASLWTDPSTREHPPKKAVFLVIGQTLTEVSVRLHSEESSSEQIAGTLAIRKSTGEHTITWTYMNAPRIDLREHSRPHYGGAVLTVFGDPPARLQGEYWTDRQSKGSLDLRGHSPVIANSFEHAASLTYRDATNTASPTPSAR
jgi:predicted pore-forming effector associated with SMODS systems